MQHGIRAMIAVDVTHVFHIAARGSFKGSAILCTSTGPTVPTWCTSHKICPISISRMTRFSCFPGTEKSLSHPAWRQHFLAPLCWREKNYLSSSHIVWIPGWFYQCAKHWGLLQSSGCVCLISQSLICSQIQPRNDCQDSIGKWPDNAEFCYSIMQMT